VKRFWISTAAHPQDNGFNILLDDRPLRLPGGNALNVPFPALATAIAQEWAQANGEFTPDDLPLTRLASTAQERVHHHRADIIGQLAAYGLNDLLCYRADNQPALAALEHEQWQPWLDWAAQTHGVHLRTTAGIVPIAQPPEASAIFTAALAALTDYQLAALGVIVPALGSLILGLAITARALTPDAAHNLAHLGELWQEDHWGADEAAAARRKIILEDIATAAHFMALCEA
jgi:chaperone required for assembly of F1-ATPase